MKKYLPLVVLVAFLFGSCNKAVEVPDINKDNIYYGMVMNSAMLTNLGDADRDRTNTFILRLATIDISETGSEYTSRMLSLELDVNLDENNMIPEGEYSLENNLLDEGAFSNILSGSTYVNMESGDYNTFTSWLINKGKLIVKHSSVPGEYEMEVDFSAKQLDREVGVAGGKSLTIMCRYSGQIGVFGLPTTNVFTTYQPYFAYAIYYPLKGDKTFWDLYVVDANYFQVFMNGTAVGKETYSAYMAEYQIITESKGMLLPTGRFDVDTYGTLTPQTLMGAAVMKSDLEEITRIVNNEPIIYIQELETSFIDYMSDGYIQLTPQGQGAYTITTETFGTLGGYKSKIDNCQIDIIPGYTGADRKDVTFKFSESLMMYMGRYTYADGTQSVPYWYLILYDGSRKEMVQMGVNVDLGCNYSTGIPTGTYTVDGTGNANTVDQGFEDQDRVIYGSCIHNGEDTYYDLLTSGTLEVTQNNDGSYKFVLDMIGNNGNAIKGTYEGKPNVSDNTNSGDEGSVETNVSAMKVMGSNKAFGQSIKWGETINLGIRPISQSINSFIEWYSISK